MTRWCCAATRRRGRNSKASPSGSTSSRASRSAGADASRSGQPDKFIAAAQHVLERAERVHVMAAEALRLDAPEHIAEIEIALPGRQVHLVAVAEAVGEPHLLHPIHIEGVDKAGHALWHEMRVI